MKVLVIGGGAREHALCRSLSLDPDVSALYCAPGNAGIAEVAELYPVDALDGAAVAALATELGAGLVVVGPEAPLVAGVADAVRAAGIPVFGPSAEAALLEGSKAFAKDVMAAAGVPTARSYVCTTPEEVDEALDAFGAPYVVKDDGLAAGKGSWSPRTWPPPARTRSAATASSSRSSSTAPRCPSSPSPTASPCCRSSPRRTSSVRSTATRAPTPAAWARTPAALGGPEAGRRGHGERPAADGRRAPPPRHPFSGLLYAGLAITSRGVRVIEFNARFGDPETQVVLARLRTPLASVLLGAATGTLHTEPPLNWREDAAVTVVIASHNYPETPRTGDPIEGLAEVAAEDAPEAYVLHAGTRREGDAVVSAGGRVLSVTATGSDLAQARERAYKAVGRIRLDGSQHRTDIAAKAAEGR